MKHPFYENIKVVCEVLIRKQLDQKSEQFVEWCLHDARREGLSWRQLQWLGGLSKVHIRKDVYHSYDWWNKDDVRQLLIEVERNPDSVDSDRYDWPPFWELNHRK